MKGIVIKPHESHEFKDCIFSVFNCAFEMLSDIPKEKQRSVSLGEANVITVDSRGGAVVLKNTDKGDLVCGYEE